MKKVLLANVLIAIALLTPLAARADLYAAAAAAEKQDFPRAFELYRELAELGSLEAQEMLAVMYVNGEGVKRDNVLGYAWAAIAMENGGGEAARGIVSQLQPHLNPAARARVAEVQAKFGMAALNDRLLPTRVVPGSLPANACKMGRPADPGSFYPPEAKRRGLSGMVFLEATVAPDGRARNVRVWYSLPTTVFDEAGRRVAFENTYSPPLENGVAVSCTIRFKVKFSVRVNGAKTVSSELQESAAETKTKAESGDPHSQLLYGLLLETRSELNTQQEDVMAWFLKAAQAGVPVAQYIVGVHSLNKPARGNQTPKGIAWLQMAADAGQADAQAALANYLLRRSPDAEALGKAQALLEKSAALGNRDGRYELAALLATAPDAGRRDPKRSLELLGRVMQYFDFDPTAFEIRAAARAMLGDFVAAQADQKTALQKAKKLGWNLTDQQARLASYAASKPWTGYFFAR